MEDGRLYKIFSEEVLGFEDRIRLCGRRCIEDDNEVFILEWIDGEKFFIGVYIGYEYR